MKRANENDAKQVQLKEFRLLTPSQAGRKKKACTPGASQPLARHQNRKSMQLKPPNRKHIALFTVYVAEI
jgi:hypothetical protein